MNKITTINNASDLNLALQLSEGYMISVTLKDKGELNHYLLTKDFPKLDMLKSLKKSRDLVVENLENLDNEVNDVNDTE